MRVSKRFQGDFGKKPNECYTLELKNFEDLVLTSGEVTATGLKNRIKNDETLLFLIEGCCLKGIAAVKKPGKKYKEDVFRKAQATVKADMFPFELGWIFILPSSRGAGFSHKLVADALSTINGYRIFATSRTNNAPIHKVLKAHGFLSHGNKYISIREKQQLTLFIRNAAQ